MRGETLRANASYKYAGLLLSSFRKSSPYIVSDAKICLGRQGGIDRRRAVRKHTLGYEDGHTIRHANFQDFGKCSP